MEIIAFESSPVEQFLAMAFAHLTYRESLRDIEVSLAVHGRKLYHVGFRSLVKNRLSPMQTKFETGF